MSVKLVGLFRIRSVSRSRLEPEIWAVVDENESIEDTEGACDNGRDPDDESEDWV
jgi:hypothetical protein